MKKRFLNFLRVLRKIILWFFACTILWVILYRFIDPPFTYLMALRYFQSEKKDGKSPNGLLSEPVRKSINKEWKDYEYISPYLPLAAVAAEDQNFFEHFGFDLAAIEKAMKNNNRKKKKRLKGASTISQQVAKNVFLFPSRNWIRKGFEVYFTFLIECLWSKERILEVYLNVVELGDGVYGVEAASKKYFRKTAMNISKNEAALLAAVLPNPVKMNPSRPSSYVLKRQAWIIKQMNNLGGTELVNSPERDRSAE